MFFLGSGPKIEERDTVAIPVDDSYEALPAKVQGFFKHALENYDFTPRLPPHPSPPRSFWDLLSEGRTLRSLPLTPPLVTPLVRQPSPVGSFAPLHPLKTTAVSNCRQWRLIIVVDEMGFKSWLRMLR